MDKSKTTGVMGLVSKIIAPFSRFLEKDVSVIGVDIGTSSIKVIQLKKRGGRAVLETYGEIALGPYAGLVIGQATRLSQEKIQEVLIDVMREANVTARSGGLSVPLMSSLVLVMEMPKMTEKELERMIPIEARKYVPMPMKEVTLDWSILPDTSEEKNIPDVKGLLKKVRVLIAAIHNDTITAYTTLAEKTGLSISFIEIEVFSSVRSLLHQERSPVLILDLGAGSTKVSIIDRGIIQTTHIINKGSQDMTNALSRSQNISILRAEEMKRELGLSSDPKNKDVTDTFMLVVRSIFGEINKLLLQYEKKHHKTISKVILSGGGSLLVGILEVAQENFDTEVVYGDPFSYVETPAFLDPTLKRAGPNFAVSLGIALRRLQEIE